MDAFFNKIITIGGEKPRQVARTVFILLLFAYSSSKLSRLISRHGFKRTFKQLFFFLFSNLGGQQYIANQLLDIKNQMRKGMHPLITKQTKCYRALPLKSIPSKKLLKKLRKWSAHETKQWDGSSRMSSGAVYHGQRSLTNLQNLTYSLFSMSNPLHPSVFPFTRKMESEIIGMTVSYFHGDPYVQCGLLTSGGTESILMCVRAYKYWARYEKNIYHPELIVPTSAHAAFNKACEMYEIKLIAIRPSDETFTVSAKDIEQLITSNTIAVVCSAVQYAQGVIDPVAQLSKLCVKHNIGLHVDSCLGSFLITTLTHMSENGEIDENIPLYDFRLPGVMSISCDTHKFGYAQKGTSVAMFKSQELRRHAYFCCGESSIGLYSTPTIPGSRNGGLIAVTWMTMLAMGVQGYKREARLIMEATNIIRVGIESNEHIRLLGDPILSIVAFVAVDDNVNIFAISDAMSTRGWSLNNCIDPQCVHMCVTRANCMFAEKFVVDLNGSVVDVLNDPMKYSQSSTAMYGVLVDVPSTEFIVDAMKNYADLLLELPLGPNEDFSMFLEEDDDGNSSIIEDEDDSDDDIFDGGNGPRNNFDDGYERKSDK